MAAYTITRRNVTQQVLTIPATQTWGADATDVVYTLEAAARIYRELFGLPVDALLTPGTITFRPKVDVLEISFDEPAVEVQS